MKYFHETFMELFQIEKTQFLDFVKDLMAGPLDVIGVVQKGNCYTYDKVENHSDICLDFPETEYSPKHFLLPPKEVLLSYRPLDSGSYEPIYSQKDQVLLGVHPCDCAAIALLDKAFSQDHYDPHYCSRRQATTIIGVYPTQISHSRFSASMLNGNEQYLAADAMLVDIDKTTYAIEIVTERGKEFFSTSAAIAATPLVIALVDKRKSENADHLSMPVDSHAFHKLIANNKDNPLWNDWEAKCFKCGSCIMVCPTCFCFDIHDEVDSSLEYGLRYRMWSACMFDTASQVTGNTTARRLWHRMMRKAGDLPDKYGIAGCVGCGRCKKACLPDIAFPVDIVNTIIGKEAHHV